MQPLWGCLGVELIEFCCLYFRLGSRRVSLVSNKKLTSYCRFNLGSGQKFALVPASLLPTRQAIVTPACSRSPLNTLCHFWRCASNPFSHNVRTAPCDHLHAAQHDHMTRDVRNGWQLVDVRTPRSKKRVSRKDRSEGNRAWKMVSIGLPGDLDFCTTAITTKNLLE